jgi:hypothetical protein
LCWIDDDLILMTLADTGQKALGPLLTIILLPQEGR